MRSRRSTVPLCLVALGLGAIVAWIAWDASAEPAAIDGESPLAPAVVSPPGDARGRLDPRDRDRGTTRALQPLAADAATPAAHERTLPFRSLRMHGRIVDIAGEALGGARVILFPSRLEREQTGQPSYFFDTPIPWSTWAQTLTDAGGRFELEHTEVASASGHRIGGGWNEYAIDDPCLVVEHPGHTLRLQPVPDIGWDVSLGDVVLASAAVVTGRVVDVDARPIAGVEVFPELTERPTQRLGWDTLQDLSTVSTDDDGRFHLDMLGDGPHRLRLSAATRRTEFRELELTPGTQVNLGTIVLHRGGVISGQVLDADRLPVAGAEIRVATTTPYNLDIAMFGLQGTLSSEPGQYERRLVTDHEGRFRTDDLEPLNHSLVVMAVGSEPLMVTGAFPDGDAVELVLQREAAVALRVVDETTGQPIADATVSVHRGPRWSHGGGPQFSADTGEAAARRLTRNGHALAAPDEDDTAESLTVGLFVGGPLATATNSASITAAGYEYAQWELPGLQPGKLHRETAALTLRRELLPGGAGSISGRTIDAQGQPLPAVVVRAQPILHRGTPQAHTVSDADGRFSFSGLAIGKWWLTAERADRLSARVESFELSAGPHPEEFVLTLEDGGLLTGVVLAEGDRPANLRFVELYRIGSNAQGQAERTAITDGDGHFRFQALPLGDYVAIARPGVPVTVRLDSAVETLIELRLQTPARLWGRLRDAAGQPVAGTVQIYASEAASDAQRFGTESNAQGAYRFDELPQLRGRLVASLDGAQTPPVDVKLDWGDDIEQDLVLGGGRIVGRVTRAGSGELQEGVKVYARRIAAEHDGPTTYPMQVSSTTDAQGHFDLAHLIPGTYDLHTYRGEWVHAQDTALEVAVDGLVTRDLEVVLTGTLEGSISIVGARPVDTKLSLQLEREGSSARPRVVVLNNSREYTVRALREGTWHYVVLPRRDSPAPVDPAEVYLQGTITVQAGGTTIEDLVVVVSTDG